MKSLGARGQAVLILALVAAVGALLGILGDRYVAARRAADTVPPMQRVGSPGGGMLPGMRYGDGLASRLDLSDEQRTRIDSILADNRVRALELTSRYQPQIRQLAEETRRSVEAVLTPEQRAQLRELRQQRMRARPDMRPDRPGRTSRPPPGADRQP